MPPRRAFLLSLAASLGPAGPARAQSWPRRVTDLLGREVTIPAEPRAVLLGEGFQLLNMALVHPDPVSLLAGIGGDLQQVDPQSHAAFRRAFPALARVPRLTAGVGQPLPAEAALALRPDLVILSAWQAASEETRRLLEHFGTLGTPVIFVDTFQDPLANTPRTIRLLGVALGREAQAEAFARFHEARVESIRARVAAAGVGPKVLFTAFPGRWDCCWAAGEGGGGEFLAALGARNVAAGLLAGQRGGTLGLEQVLMLEPEVYIGTGLYRPGDSGGLQLGTGAPAEVAAASLARVLRAPELAGLPAVRAGRAHGLWNFFAGTAINVVALEAVARWVRPDLFGDLDPAATLAEINRRFAALPFEGTYWVSQGAPQ
ncbi:ABC transporter substrate-binding protein [Roseomonas sp. M0104]|uniref:ABC transporter substrate-binding protein n=1 Tax=Teichococcus coralli TaxID=2545983 RepID=A0A845BFK4_9PROT|nr:ABC transporter substrate-binding protein [Pseudoroseomonas coralli]MXP64117.1 ABC transporter substrate-binding protein [Pseudoroseomonas coralli]